MAYTLHSLVKFDLCLQFNFNSNSDKRPETDILGSQGPSNFHLNFHIATSY